MRNCRISAFLTLLTALTFSHRLLGQDSGPARNAQAKPKAESQSVDPHDLSGFWEVSQSALMPCSISGERPPFTPAGQAKFAAAMPTMNEKTLGKGIIPEKQWNDGILECDPAGYPRVMFFAPGISIRIIQTPTDVVEFFERDLHTWRDIWTDGRKLPKSSDAESKYYGYSVGHWDGNTLVISANNFDDRTWLDWYGSPHTDQMQLDETLRRADRGHLEWTITVTDPKTYTKPWVSGKKILDGVPNSTRNPVQNWGKKADGTPWGDLREDPCIWSDQDTFFKNVDSVGLSDAPAKGNK